MGTVLALLRTLQRLAILRWLGSAFCALAMLCATAATASALERVQTKTRVRGFELAEHHSSGLSSSASSRTRLAFSPSHFEVVSGSPHAARAGAGLGRLRSIGPSTWESSGGLLYGPDKVFGNRVQHVLAHTVADASKPVHSVFNVGRSNVLGLVDEAWAMRGAPLAGDAGAFVVPMGRVVGTAGETAVKIVVRPGTNQIITAFPVIP